MSTMVSQITGVSIVYWTVCSGVDQKKHQSSASLAFVRGIHRWSVRRATTAENVTISCIGSRFHAWNWWFFYSIITFLYTKYSVHSYTVDISLYSFLSSCLWNVEGNGRVIQRSEGIVTKSHSHHGISGQMGNRLLGQQFDQANIKIKAPYYWPFVRESTTNRRMPLTKVYSTTESVSMSYDMMTSSNGNIFRVTGPSSPVNSPHKG